MTKKLIAALLFGASLSVAHAAIELVDRIIAVVGKDVVMLSELKSRAQENYSQLASAIPMHCLRKSKFSLALLMISS